jgi:hypothetical protein
VQTDLAGIVELEAALDRLLLPPAPAERPDPSWLDGARQWSSAVWSHAGALGAASPTPAMVARGLALAARPVFICGAHRSGTSLLRNLLDGHPALAVLPSEGTFYTNLEPRLAGLPPREQVSEMGQEWLRRLANPSNQPPFLLLGRSGAQASPYVEFARDLSAWWSILARGAGARWRQWPLVAVALAWAHRLGDGAIPDRLERWVEKTPTNERYLARLWAEFPEAKVIHVIRRPEAALASHKALLGARWRPGREVAAVYRNMARSLRIAVQQSRLAPSDRYLLVRYEDLVAEPAAAGRRLAAFLGIEPLPSLAEPTVATIPVSANSSFAGDRSRHKPALPLIERAILAAMSGGAALRLGYR